MPSITLRIPQADYETLREMAKWKEVSLSDLIRQYSVAGVRQDAASTSIRERIERQIEEETNRLQRIRSFLEQAAGGTATATDATATDATATDATATDATASSEAGEAETEQSGGR